MSQPSSKRPQPIENIQWLDVDTLTANDYNPNFVYGPEMRLLERSLLVTGWIQPILVDQNREIIDGFHRSTLAKTSAKVRAMTDGKVPCAVLDLSAPERMLLTVRINRAKGSHISVKMHELVHRLVTEFAMDPDYIAQSIGATKDEVELLMEDGVFVALKTEHHKYSKAWGPK